MSIYNFEEPKSYAEVRLLFEGAKTSSYTMDAILVIDGYNRLLCIDVYLPDYATIRPIPK